MKKIVTLILISFIINLSVTCQQKFLTRVQTDGSESKVYLVKNSNKFVLYDSDNTYTKTFKGFENFDELDYIECMTLPYVESYDFLADVVSCKKIGIGYGKYFDFNILKNVKNLEELIFVGYISDEDFEKIKRDGIDLSELKYLKKFTFNLIGRKIDFDLKIKYAEDVSEEK